MGEKSFLFFISLSRRAPQAPRLPGDWDPGARQEPRTVDSADRLLSALPQSPTSQSSRFAESYKWSLPLSRKVTNLNQDLTWRWISWELRIFDFRFSIRERKASFDADAGHRNCKFGI